ncbi:MAG: hypothetical protein M3460_19340 [Actinomycetota bacterium]|nr:hypothetical protein [Actinomycetota bacterium]
MRGSSIGVPVARSQIRTVWSRLLATAIGWPSSWVQATAVVTATVAAVRVP